VLAGEDGALIMLAAADDGGTLDRVKDVTGRHLERFGAKDGPVVTGQQPLVRRRLPRLVRPG